VAVTHRARRLTGALASPRHLAEILYRIRGLRMIGHVLHVGAHPDDEDAGLMAFVARKYGARIVYWSATRGEAGQNRIGSHSGDALGIYRTWESLAAREIDGGESWYGPFYDFGYGSSGPEAVAKWGWDALVREIVRAIRLVQPQVLVGRYSGEASDGHGQHQAIGAATVEAFDAAADPARFPELGLPVWQTSKLYQSTDGDWQADEQRTSGQRRAEFERDGYLRIDAGEHDPIAGMSYQQQAVLALNCHQTQAIGFVPEPGSYFYYYRLKKSLVPTSARERSLYDGLDPSLLGLADWAGGGTPSDFSGTLETILTEIDAALSRFRPDDPAAAAGPLVAGLERLRRLRTQVDDIQALGRQLDHKIASFEDAILACLGLDVDCVAERAHVTPGERVRIVGRLLNPLDVRIDRSRLSLCVPDGWDVTPVSTHDPAQHVGYEVVVPVDAPVSAPSWLREPHDAYRYTVADETFACEALDAPPVVLQCDIVFAGQRLTVQRPATRREPFAGGYRELPLSVLPAVSVRPQLRRIFLPVDATRRTIDVNAAVQRHVDQRSQTGRLQIVTPEGWSVDPPFVELPVGLQGDIVSTRSQITVPRDATAGRYRLEYLLGARHAHPAVTFEPVWMGAPGLPRAPDATTCIREAFLTTPASVDVDVIAATFAHRLIYGYVRGAAEGLLTALVNLDLNVSVISDEEMSFLDLSMFDAIVVGPNAYLLRDELRRNARRFLDYAAKGGTLIVQYQAYAYELHDYAPYPFHYNHPHDRITDSDALVTILEPQHPLMTHPNQMSADDFGGWVHDRGLYFFGSFDDRYTPILGCSGPDGELKRGGLVVAGYGRGAFVYVGYSLFRQAPAGVPGAFRLLANLLALPEALLLERVERLRTLSFFAFMTDEQLVAVARIAAETYTSAGTYLCRQGQLGQELFIVLKGEIEIIRRIEGGRVVLKAREGQVVGESAILADTPRTADLRALTNVHLLVISGVQFRALIRQHAEIAENVIRHLVTKLEIS
jgi:LmbE family N-acetylglucosaminyl deacetylase